MESYGFKKIADWYINQDGKLDIDFPPSLEDTSGVLAFTNDGFPVFLGATSHYGPRIRDFKHTRNGDTTKARIHHLIENSLRAGNPVTEWRKDSPSPFRLRNQLIEDLNPSWNRK